MLAQLIQALYNIVDSLFVGKYSETGLTALSIIYPLQLLMIALAVGTGVGINTDMAYYFGIRQEKKAEEVAGIGTPLAVFLWIVFAAVCFMRGFRQIQKKSYEMLSYMEESSAWSVSDCLQKESGAKSCRHAEI